MKFLALACVGVALQLKSNNNMIIASTHWSEAKLDDVQKDQWANLKKLIGINNPEKVREGLKGYYENQEKWWTDVFVQFVLGKPTKEEEEAYCLQTISDMAAISNDPDGVTPNDMAQGLVFGFERPMGRVCMAMQHYFRQEMAKKLAQIAQIAALYQSKLLEAAITSTFVREVRPGCTTGDCTTTLYGQLLGYLLIHTWPPATPISPAPEKKSPPISPAPEMKGRRSTTGFTGFSAVPEHQGAPTTTSPWDDID